MAGSSSIGRFQSVSVLKTRMKSLARMSAQLWAGLFPWIDLCFCPCFDHGALLIAREQFIHVASIVPIALGNNTAHELRQISGVNNQLVPEGSPMIYQRWLKLFLTLICAAALAVELSAAEQPSKDSGALSGLPAEVRTALDRAAMVYAEPLAGAKWG